jgi:hypothetical protein
MDPDLTKLRLSLSIVKLINELYAMAHRRSGTWA